MTEFIRKPHHRYEDPLARIWTACASAVGFRIARSRDVYAATDGEGTIYLGTDDILDPDDSLAQMILHELCHALVEGEAGECQPDWGLDNTSGRDTWHEHACLRLQAYLTAAWGLREFFAPTTDFRVKFWNTMADDPFQPPIFGTRSEPSCVAARTAAWRASLPRWQIPLTQAFEATVRVLVAVNSVVDGTTGAVTKTSALPSLYGTVRPVPAMHAAGHSFVAPWHGQERCVGCAWSYDKRGRTRCRHSGTAPITPEMLACARWEARADLACGTCGACCREAYDAVEVGRREVLVRYHPSLVETAGSRSLRVKRVDGRCAALSGGAEKNDGYWCSVYEDRPRTCREFELGGDHCLTARRKVGLSL